MMSMDKSFEYNNNNENLNILKDKNELTASFSKLEIN